MAVQPIRNRQVMGSNPICGSQNVRFGGHFDLTDDDQDDIVRPIIGGDFA